SEYENRDVLILGGAGFGLVAQLANKATASITVVDIPQTVIELAEKFFPELSEFRDGAEIITRDCFLFLEEGLERYKVIFADLSGSAEEEDKLFEPRWIDGIGRRLEWDGIFITYLDNCLFYP